MNWHKVLDEGLFPAANRSAWEALARKAMRGSSLADTMQFETEDGHGLPSLSPRKKNPAPLARVNPAKPWFCVQRCDDPDTERANRQALDDVANGANGLALVFEGAPNAFGHGLPLEPGTLSRVLDGISLNSVHLRIDPHPASRAMADQLVAFLTAKRVDPARLSVSFGIDAAAIFASTGRLRMSIEALKASMPQSLAHFFAMGLPGVLLEADGRVFHNAGATAAQELGLMLAGAVGHLRVFQEARQALVYSAPHIGFALSVDQDQFTSMAKIKAMRLIWRRAQELCAIAPAKAFIHAETSMRMMTREDAETNILRATIAAFAGAVGGADSIAVLPHTIVHGLPAPLARRIVRNMQLILAQESHLDFVADPAAGAGGIETLADAICEDAWTVFQEIEAEGGILASLASGKTQARIAVANENRRAEITAGRRTIVGVTGFRPLAERAVETLPAETRPIPTDGTVFCERLEPVRLETFAGAAA